MPNKKTYALIVAAFVILVICISVTMKRSTPSNKIDVSFTEKELDDLGHKINNLEFDDIQGLNPDNSTTISFSLTDLDQLGNSIESLEFEDLEGLSST